MNERHCHPAATAIALLAFVLAAPVAAQGTSISVYGGLRGSGQGLRSNSQPEQTLRLASSPTLSLALGWPVDPARQLELFASRQQSELKLAAPGTTTTFVPVRLSLLHLGGTNFIGGHIGHGTYVMGGLGFTQFSLGLAGFESETRLSMNLGVGYQLPLSTQLAVRAELRGFATLIRSSGSFLCSAGCTVSIQGESLTQVEALLGLSWSF